MKRITTDKTFVEAFVSGEATVYDLNDYFEYWRTHDTGKKLYEFLGLTTHEYAQWLMFSAKPHLQDLTGARGEAVMMGLLQMAKED